MENQLLNSITIKEGENLNKNNFWNKAQEIYPTATKMFCVWIDMYKKQRFSSPSTVDWENWSVIGYDSIGGYSGLKFHEIPIEMQIGILYRFFYEVSQIPQYTIVGLSAPNYFHRIGWIESVCTMLMLIEYSALSKNITEQPAQSDV